MSKTKKNIGATFFTALLVFSSNQGNTTPFLAMDARSVGMGGTGVAIGNSSQAHYYNPALLVSAPASEDFNVLGDASVRAVDPDSLADNLNEFGEQRTFSRFIQDFTDITNLILEANQNDNVLTTSELQEIINQQTLLVESANNLREGIQDITNRSLTGHGAAGIFMSSPGKDYGWAAFFNVHLPISAQGNLHPDDDQLMAEIIDVASTELNRDDLVESLNTLNNMRQTLLEEDPEDRLASDVSVYGAYIREFGFSYATQSTLNTYEFDFGISPKIMLVQAFDQTRSLNRIQREENIQKSGTVESYSSLNLDFGIAKRLTDHWKTGLSVKNLIPQRFKTPNGETIKIDPAARIGASYQSKWFNFAADLDLTHNSNGLGYGSSQYAGLGLEFDIWLMQLRTGYRINLANEVSYPSLGIGLYVLGFNFEAGIATRIPKVEKGGDVWDTVSGLDDVNGALRIGAKW